MIQVSKPSVGEEELQRVRQVFSSGWLGMGSETEQFEEKVKEFLGAKHVVAVSSGTAALHLALEALNLPYHTRAEVIVPSLTFAASIQAILNAGLKPVFCEVNPETLNIDPEDVKRKFSDYTCAIMPVHFRGLACDMEGLYNSSCGNYLIQDAAHAFGSYYKKCLIGSSGFAVCFSFDPIKTITCGEGGAIATNSSSLAEILKLTRNVGRLHRSTSETGSEIRTHGWRYHMSNINAAIGLAQLDKMKSFTKRRWEIVNQYDKAFSELGWFKPFYNDPGMVPFIYMARVPTHRNSLMEHLKKRGVDSSITYVPCHMQPFFKQFSHERLPITESLFNEIITIPLYTDMTNEDVETVICGVLSFKEI